MAILRRIINVYYAVALFLFSIASFAALLDMHFNDYSARGWGYNPSLLEMIGAIIMLLALLCLVIAIVVSIISLAKKTEVAFRSKATIALAIIAAAIYLFVTFAGEGVFPPARETYQCPVTSQDANGNCIVPI